MNKPKKDDLITMDVPIANLDQTSDNKSSNINNPIKVLSNSDGSSPPSNILESDLVTTTKG